MKRIFIFLCSVLFPTSLLAAFAIFQTYSTVPIITCNIITGVSTESSPCASPVATCNGDGITNDIAAFVSFKTWAIANQGTSQIVLTIPNGANCQLNPASNQILIFKGIKNLIVSGYGATITNLGGTQPLLFGGTGVAFNNRASFRIQTANPGDTCVTIKTQPLTNISNVTNGVGSAVLTGSIAPGPGSLTGILTVTAISSGTMATGQVIFGVGTASGTVITGQLTGSAGSTGTYSLSSSQTISSQTLSAIGTVRLTVASTAGYSDGDTVFVKNVVGNQTLTNKANGLWWAKIPDGTHIDLFQSTYTAGSSYTSGGTVGGDRTNELAVGSKIMLGGWTHQTYWYSPYGDPPNLQWFEWKTVTSLNSSTQEVCFDSSLTHTYKSTWPQLNTGDFFHSDSGGPATMYLLDPTWETSQEYRGLTISNPNFQIIANGRTIKFTDVTTTDASCVAPSQNETFSWVNFTGINCNIEIDKLIGTLNVTNSTLLKIFFQSSSTQVVNFTNSTLIKQLSGTPRSMIANNLTINGVGTSGNASLSIGTAAYGATDKAVSCTNCVIANVGAGIDPGNSPQPVNPQWVFNSDGTIVIPNWLSYSSGNFEIQTRFFVPGSNFFLETTGGVKYTGGTVTDVTQTLTDTIIHTSFTSGFPAAPVGGTVSVTANAAPSFTCTSCTGNSLAVAFSACPAALPFLSCYTSSYTGSATGTTASPTFRMWGKFNSLVMTPNPVYAGAGGLTWLFSQFANWPIIKVSDGSSVNFPSEIVNMKTGGTRTVTLLSVTGNVAGDTLSAPGFDVWFGRAGNSGPVFSANTPSDSPVMIMQMLTDQNISYPSVFQ